MKKKYHMITGLPRSGSTLLNSILNQNPKFYTDSSNNLFLVIQKLVEMLQNDVSNLDLEKANNIVKNVIEGYYIDEYHPTIFNTHRLWTLYLPLIKNLYNDSKIIICVRDIHDILDSFESTFRRNFLSNNNLTDKSSTVYSRINTLMSDEGIVGKSYIGVKQAITSQLPYDIMLVEYEKLCENPEGIMRALYNFINEEYFEHDFNSIEYMWDEFDPEYYLDKSTIKAKLEHIPNNKILPPDILQKYSNMEVWR